MARLALIFLVSIVLIGAGAYLLFSQHADPVIISMDGLNVTLSQAENAYAALPPTVQMRLSKHDFLTQAYPRKLVLIRAAEDAGLSLPMENASEVVRQIKLQFAMQNESLDAYLHARGLTEEDFTRFLAEDMLIQTYLQRILSDVNITVTENETRRLYELSNLSQQNLTYENVSSQLAELVRQQKEQAWLEQYIAFLLMKYNVTVHEDVITRELERNGE